MFAFIMHNNRQSSQHVAASENLEKEFLPQNRPKIQFIYR